MTNPHSLYALLISTQIASAFGAMYEAYTIEPAGFVVNTTSGQIGQMTHFMCSANADKTGHTAFRISNDTGKCEMGSITKDATQHHDGIKVYVESGITIKTCAISPTIASQPDTINGYVQTDEVKARKSWDEILFQLPSFYNTSR